MAIRDFGSSLLSDVRKRKDAQTRSARKYARSQKKKDLILELIGIDYLKNKDNYEINLIFDNNSHISLKSETIEVRLEDQNEIK